jgi:hypothetical protein
VRPLWTYVIEKRRTFLRWNGGGTSSPRLSVTSLMQIINLNPCHSQARTPFPMLISRNTTTTEETGLSLHAGVTLAANLNYYFENKLLISRYLLFENHKFESQK